MTRLDLERMTKVKTGVTGEAQKGAEWPLPVTIYRDEARDKAYMVHEPSGEYCEVTTSGKLSPGQWKKLGE